MCGRKIIFGVGTTFPPEIMDVGTERDMLN